MPLNPRCIACGKKAPIWEYRPYCSPLCDPRGPVKEATKLLSQKPAEKKAPAKPDTKKDKE